MSRRPAGLSLQENLKNRLYEGKQLTAASITGPGASSASLTWDAIDWRPVEKHVRRLQVRIAKATAEGRWGKVKALQRLLTHSFYAKLLAVKRVTGNQGAKTPGVDRVLWRTSRQKLEAAMCLRRRGVSPPTVATHIYPEKESSAAAARHTDDGGQSSSIVILVCAGTYLGNVPIETPMGFGPSGVLPMPLLNVLTCFAGKHRRNGFWREISKAASIVLIMTGCWPISPWTRTYSASG